MVVVKSVKKTVVIMVANSYIEKPNSGFWKEINKYRGKKRCIAPTVEGLTNSTEISDRFAATYDELFNSVGYDVNDMNTLFHEVCGDVVDDYTVHSTLMSSDDVTSAIKKLKPGKSDGYQGRPQDLGGGGPRNFFFRFGNLRVAKRHAAHGEAIRIARGVRGHAPPRNFFKTVQFGAF